MDFSDDVASCCALLFFLDECTTAVPSYFDHNLQIGSKETDISIIKHLLGGCSPETSSFHNECLREYRSFQYDDARGAVTEAPPGLESGLDGSYWEKN